MPFDQMTNFTNPVTGRPFAGQRNLAALVSAGMGEQWATFQQWRSIGRIVRKGEKATTLNGPGFRFHVFAVVQTDLIEAQTDPSKAIARPVQITPPDTDTAALSCWYLMDAARKLYWAGHADQLDRVMAAKVVAINARAQAAKVLDDHYTSTRLGPAVAAICSYAVDLYRLGVFEQSERVILRKVDPVVVKRLPRTRIRKAKVEEVVAGRWERHPVTGHSMFVRDGVMLADVIPFGNDPKGLAAVRAEWARHGRIGAANLLVSLARDGLADDAKSYRKGMQSRRAESYEGAVRYSHGPGSIDVTKVLEAVEYRDDGSTRAIALR